MSTVLPLPIVAGLPGAPVSRVAAHRPVPASSAMSRPPSLALHRAADRLPVRAAPAETS